MARFDERDDIRERYGKPQRPAVQFTRRDDVRDLMKSPMGQNYGNMMDLQSQAARQGGFDRGDPRVAELKAARRQYNRQDKYNIGNLMGYDPLEVQDMYRRNSEVLREHARPTYKQMYPVTDIARQVSGGGGLTGMLFSKILGRSKKAGKNFFDDLRGMGRDILGGVGIGGADRDVSEKELDDYAEKTFGFYPSDVHPGTSLYYDRPEELEFDVDPNQPYVAPDDYVEEDFGAFYTDEDTLAEPYQEPLPFDDSGREAGIAALYGQGPMWGETDRRYENEYRDHIERTGERMTYEEFERAWERLHALPRGLHYQEPRAGIR